MKTIGVLGAGVMGIGVAQCAALAADQVILIDTEAAQLHNARNQIRQNLRMQRLFNTNGPKGEPGILNRITFTTDYEELKDSDFIIENDVEKWAIKEQFYR